MKIEEQVLSREQMKHLQELGVDTSDASMAWFMSPKTKQWKIKVKNNFSHELLLRLSPERYIPTYTIGDLIEKVSKLFNGFDFSGGKSKDMLYYCLCWMAKNKKELIK